jgi:hypothetical protein
MDRELEYKLSEYTSKIKYRKAAIKRHQEQLLSGELRTRLIGITEANIKRMQDEIKKLETQVRQKTKQHEKLLIDRERIRSAGEENKFLNKKLQKRD